MHPAITEKAKWHCFQQCSAHYTVLNSMKSVSAINPVALEIWVIGSHRKAMLHYHVLIFFALSAQRTGDRDPPIMLIILPIMLCCTAQKFTYYA